MIARYPALVSLLLGAIAALGFAPLQLWPLTLIGLAGWLWLVHAAPTLRGALWRGWLFGVGHFTIANNWIQQAFEYQQTMPPVLGYGAVVALALYLAVYPMLAAGLAWRAGAQPGAARRAVRAGGGGGLDRHRMAPRRDVHRLCVGFARGRVGAGPAGRRARWTVRHLRTVGSDGGLCRAVPAVRQPTPAACFGGVRASAARRHARAQLSDP